MAETKIEWADAVWNPITGCTKVSQGCKNCYAETMAQRMWRRQYPPNPDGTPRKFKDIRVHEDRLGLPLGWKKPRRIFVNSMSDLFHEQVPVEFIQRVFAVMVAARQHTFMVLTKRAERMADVLNRLLVMSLALPTYSNIWLGVSAEDQHTADQRIPLLLHTPAAVRFVSCEPLLSKVDLRDWLAPGVVSAGIVSSGVNWVIAGGESGRDARPMNPVWARSLRDQCQEAGTAFFFKQFGEWKPAFESEWEAKGMPGGLYDRVGKDAAGRELDGRTWDEFPKVQDIDQP